MSKIKKRIIWIIVIIAVAIGGYYLLKPKPSVTVYTTADVVKGNLAQTVSETGTIKTVNQTDLSFKISGRVVKLLAEVGDTIKVGQLLAELDSGTLLSQFKQAQYEVKVQKETLANMKDNKSTYGQDQRDAQGARIKSAEESVVAVRTQLRDTRMYSPIDGVILKRNVDPYETTVANSPTPVFTVGNPGDLVIETNIPESDIIKIKIGQNAKVTFDALPIEQIFQAKVEKIDPASTVIQDVVYYQIKLKLAQKDELIKPGMSANIDIATAEKNDVLMIPLRAVQTEGTAVLATGGQKYAQVLTDAKNNIIQRKNITTGLEGDEGMVEVTSGLKAGEKVVTFTKTQ